MYVCYSYKHCKKLNSELFIARRISGSKTGSTRISAPVVNISVIGIALGLAVMIVAVAIVTGFQIEVTNKVTGFGAHIQITNFDSNNSFETQPINKNQVNRSLLNNVKGITHSQLFVTKSGIIKTNDQIQAVVLKGISTDFNWSFFKRSMLRGDTLNIIDNKKSNGIIISEYIANLLNIDIGSKLTVYFVKNPPRMRPFIVSGIYKTSIEDFDKVFAIVDMRHLQKILDWDSCQVSGYEVLIDNFNNIVPLTDSVFDIAGYQFADNGNKLKITNIKDRYPQIFYWLDLQNMNVWVILALMLIVAGFNMISGLLIIILERTNMIGLLKAVGYNNWRIRKIFMYQSSFLIAKGLLWGNLLALAICFLQLKFKIFPLNEATYYIDAVPINLVWWHILLLNIGTMLTTVTIMLLPTMLISKISPAKAIKFN